MFYLLFVKNIFINLLFQQKFYMKEKIAWIKINYKAFSFHSGKNVLNQKSELQRALEKHREAVSRREAERIREESYKDDPRTALQRAIEQRARNIQLTVIWHI